MVEPAMKLRLNLATNALQNNRPFVVGSGVTGTLGLIALVILSHAAYINWNMNRDLRQKISAAEDQISASERQQHELALLFQTPNSRQILDRSAFLNGMIQQRAFPWTKIFMDLEDTLPAGVRVITIAPHLENGRVAVKLVIGAVNDESKVKFLRALEGSKAFSGIRVDGEKRVDNSQGQPDRVMLEIEAWYETT
jgi:Tfp pilus assembly protein PilN